MKKIYIVLTHTGTILSNIIKKYTKHTYTHVSISLDKELNELYSFGRLNPYNAFLGGFVKEGINIGTFKRFKNTKTEIYELEVDDLQQEKIRNIINIMKSRKNRYKFNTLGLILVSINKKIIRKNTFYCAEFVRYLLKRAGIDVSMMPKIVRPEDLKKVKGLKLVYTGILKEYK